MAQVGRLGPKVSSHLALLCIHRVNRVNTRNESHDDSTIKIVLGIIIIIIKNLYAYQYHTNYLSMCSSFSRDFGLQYEWGLRTPNLGEGEAVVGSGMVPAIRTSVGVLML